MDAIMSLAAGAGLLGVVYLVVNGTGGKPPMTNTGTPIKEPCRPTLDTGSDPYIAGRPAKLGGAASSTGTEIDPQTTRTTDTPLIDWETVDHP